MRHWCAWVRTYTREISYSQSEEFTVCAGNPSAEIPQRETGSGPGSTSTIAQPLLRMHVRIAHPRNVDLAARYVVVDSESAN